MRQAALENRIPPPIVLSITILLIWFIAGYDTSLEFINLEVTSYQRWASAILFTVAGLILDVSSVILFFKSKTTINPLKPSTSNRLVIKGFFKVSRNPMYLGMSLIAFGAVCYFASPISLIAVLGFVCFITRYQIIPEERAMLAIFGDEFTEYQQRVHRWF